MTRKKVEPRSKGPQWIDGDLYFGREDLLEYELAQERLKQVALQEKIHKLEKDVLTLQASVQQVQAQLTFHNKAEITEKTKKKLVDELKTLQDSYQMEYNIDLGKITYNNITGRISQDGHPIKKEGRE